MLYKTMVLEFLQQRSQLHDQLRKDRKLLPTLNRLATELKTSHEAWKEQLAMALPGSDQSQIASEALEIALKELEDSLPAESPPDESETLSLDARNRCRAHPQGAVSSPGGSRPQATAPATRATASRAFVRPGGRMVLHFANNFVS
jgi:hypothetical protein